MRPNPNPARISVALWWLINALTDLTPTSFVDEHGGVWVRQPGSHADAGWLKINRPNDYSLRGMLQQTGPQNYGRAWDWTFPSAQAGNYDAIVMYSSRIRNAWNTLDPRTWPIFEVLCEADYDYDPEGYVFYPERSFRVPDRSHKWHIHLGILTAFIDDMEAMDAIYSIFVGETLTQYQNRKNPPTNNQEDDVKLYYVVGRGWVRVGATFQPLTTQGAANVTASVWGNADTSKTVEWYDALKATYAPEDVREPI